MDYKSYNDENILIKDLIKGSEGAYGYLFRHYHKELCNYLMAISGDSRLAEEIAQQTFVKIWEKRKKLNVQENGFKNYFFTIAYNLFIDAKRQESKKFKLLENLKKDAYAEVFKVDYSEFEERLKIVEAEIENLPDQCKRVFLMGKREGLRYKEISEILHISIKTVEVHMSKALRRLRTQLSSFF
tara:strand:- start:38180 stop:38734 length:555 start_codon:yes stop_codon:yes gene_type:complete